MTELNESEPFAIHENVIARYDKDSARLPLFHKGANPTAFNPFYAHLSTVSPP